MSSSTLPRPFDPADRPADERTRVGAPRSLIAARGERTDGLSTGQRRAAIGAIVAAHIAGVWALMQVSEVRDAARTAMPMFVDLIAPAAPPAPPAPVELPAPKPLPVEKPRPVARRPAPAPAQIAAPAAPSNFTAPQAPAEPALAAPAPEAPAAVAAPAAAPQPAPAPPPPRNIPDSAVAYLVEPAPVYPRASSRNRETGRVMVRVLIDEAGLPRQVSLARSSGFPRLDESAVAAVSASRFRPPMVEGRPVSGWTLVPIDFALEN